MIDKSTIVELVKKAKSETPSRKFKQSVEFYVMLDSHRVKLQDVNVNEIVSLPGHAGGQASVAVIATGELGLRAKRAGADTVIAGDEIDRLTTNKKDSKKLARDFDFFMAETSLMPKIGKSLGPFLGPRGKMPLPITLTSPVDQLVERLKGSTRIRARGHGGISCRIGEEDMDDDKLASNAMAVLEALERKVPNGLKSVKAIGVKLTMGPIKKVAIAGE
ncbi:MAG: 50S ribosomal protein L1 [Nitrososphaerota archaeon]|nr:50S ribosomal protein L1 [Nitrososphaerota archaeon]